MSSNKKKNLLMLALVFCCCLVSVGYFTLVKTAVVKGNIKFEPAKWDISFKSIKTSNTIGNASNYRRPELSSQVISFFADFKEVGDSITYDIEIVNNGNIDAELAGINIYDGKIDSIEYEHSGIEVGQILKSGKKTTMKFKIIYSKVSEKTNEDKVMLILNWKQAD